MIKILSKVLKMDIQYEKGNAIAKDLLSRKYKKRIVKPKRPRVLTKKT